MIKQVCMWYTGNYVFDFSLICYDQAHSDITAMEQVMANLHESASLFEVNIPDYKQLKACRREVRYCKSL